MSEIKTGNRISKEILNIWVDQDKYPDFKPTLKILLQLLEEAEETFLKSCKADCNKEGLNYGCPRECIIGNWLKKYRWGKFEQ